MVARMLCLIGEQPVPNLLPIRLLQPKEVVLYYTGYTQKRSEYLSAVLANDGIACRQKEIKFPYNMEEIMPIIAEEVDKTDSKTVINLTGGTKPMAFAGFEISRAKRLPFCYLQSEGKSHLLYFYVWDDDVLALKGGCAQKIEDDLISIEDYLKIYLGDYYQGDFANSFERSVYNALKDHVAEITYSIKKGGSLEIDLIFRYGNRLGVAELKTGKSALKKEGIDQLNAACAREYLGTYTKKFLIIDREYPPNNKELAEARNINVVELTKSMDKEEIVDTDREILIQLVTGAFG
ncbi:MAG TPA: DUF1887 family protein [Clostridia bacterium]|nr:DUF1887 family protein [Clostridia bacterium]